MSDGITDMMIEQEKPRKNITKEDIMDILAFHSEGGTDKNNDYTGVIPKLYYDDIADEILKLINR